MQQIRDLIGAASPGARVCSFVQDPELRYTSVTGRLFGHAATAAIGCTDRDLLPAAAAEPLMARKRHALAQGQAIACELSLASGPATVWYDVHAEPMRDRRGRVIGLAGTVIDITQHKRNEEHLRLVMRELTHRSKNLLAVIQAMARQTARHAGTLDAFLERFGARLQALATAHDLLAQAGWHGASLLELVRLQIGPYVERYPGRIAMAGPEILLKPEAAQTLGLALHELAANAVRHGALSVAAGRVHVGWRRMPPAEGFGVEVTWIEEGGPPVAAAVERGFGSMVIERNVARSLDAEVEWNLSAAGLRCRILLPVTQLVVSVPADAAGRQ